MPGRSYTGNGYRYGFNGKEKDDEVSGNGNQYDYGFRIYNPRLGKFLSVDPLAKSFPWNSTYAFAENDVISCFDLEGLEKIYYHDAQAKKYIGLKQAIEVLNSANILQEIQKAFSFNNSKTDIHIVVSKLTSETRPNYKGETYLYGASTDNSTSGKKIDLMDMRDDHPTLSLKPIIETTLRDNKKVIMVTIDESLVIDAGTNPQSLKETAFTIAHELSFHAVKMKDMNKETTAGQDHATAYNDKTLAKHVFSPKYQEIKPDSDAGRLKARIEKVVNEKAKK